MGSFKIKHQKLYSFSLVSSIGNSFEYTVKREFESRQVFLSKPGFITNWIVSSTNCTFYIAMIKETKDDKTLKIFCNDWNGSIQSHLTNKLITRKYNYWMVNVKTVIL